MLNNGQARIERMGNNRFKLIMKLPISAVGRKAKEQKENSKVFKCSNRLECDLWTARILECIIQNSLKKPEKLPFSTSQSFISSPVRYSLAADLLTLTGQSNS